MTYISLDPSKFQTLIDDLKSFQTQVEWSVQVVINDNRPHDYPLSLDLNTFCEWSDIDKCDLAAQISDLQARLDAATAANESGLAFADPDGTMYYYIPDDMQDTADNATAYNNVAIVNQARADANTLVDYSAGCSPEEWDALLTRLQEHQDDPAYANTILANIGPGRLLDLPTDVQETLSRSSQQLGVTESDRPDAGQNLCGVLGHILAAASRTWPESKSTQYANRLADMTEEKGKTVRIHTLNGILLTSQEVDIDHDGEPNSVGLDYGDTFLLTLAGRMENYSPQGQDDSSPRDWIRRLDEYASHDNPYCPEHVYSGNPLVGVVHAMTGNAEVCQEWLAPRPADAEAPTVISTTQAGGAVQRIQGIINRNSLEDQAWTTDWAILAYEVDAQDWVSPVPTDMSQGERNYQRSASATVVSGILNGLGSSEKPVSLSDTARNMVSTVFSHHPDSVVTSAEEGNPDSPISVTETGTNTGDMMYSCAPLLSDRALTNLIGQISLNDAASDRLGESIADYNREMFDTALAEYRRSGDEKILIEAIKRQSTTNGFFSGAAGYHDIALAQEADAVSRDTNRTVSFMASLIPVVGATASYVTDMAKPFNENHESSARSRANSMESVALDQNFDQVTVALLDSGLYTKEDLLAAVHDAKTPDTDLVVDESGKPLTADMDPSQLTNPDVNSGITHVGEHLYHRTDDDAEDELDFREKINSYFNEGHGAALPAGGGAPAHAWN